MKIYYKLQIIVLIYCLINGVLTNNLNAQNKTVRIAIAQICCLDGDRSGNFIRIENAIIEAKDKGADIITFPETSILGWINPVAHQRSYPIPGADSDRVCYLAKKHNILIAIGMAEKDGNDLFDSAILVDNNGEILLKHRKINILSELMTPSYKSGDSVLAVKTRFGKIGMLICADSFKDEILINMKHQKPNLVIIPYGWAAQEDEWPEFGNTLTEVVKNVSKVVECPVVGTNLVGEISNSPWKGRIYGGQSVVVNKSADILKLGKDRDKNIFIVDLKYY